MLSAIIDFSLKNKFIVLLATVALALGGLYALRNIPLDAIPDLSDTQVIIYTESPGQAPQIVQDQVTYPITTKMLSVPRAKVVRGYSFYGYSFVYVIFADGTDPYWARSRVLEYLSSLSSRLPQGVRHRQPKGPVNLYLHPPRQISTLPAAHEAIVLFYVTFGIEL
jgi:copper/silver efflux system protein